MPKTAPVRHSQAHPTAARDSHAEAKPGTSAPAGHKRGFLLEFIRNPSEIGSFTPSSKYLARKMVTLARLGDAGVVVEYGVGTGPMTGHIVKGLRPGARFFGVEINPKFAAMAREAHPGVKVHVGSAEHIAEFCAAEGIKPPEAGAGIDAILSGIPWASLPAKVQNGILAATLRMLKPGGRLVTFGYSIGLLTPAGQRFHKLLPKHFSRVERSPLVWRNVPPAFVLVCTK